MHSVLFAWNLAGAGGIEMEGPLCAVPRLQPAFVRYTGSTHWVSKEEWFAWLLATACLCHMVSGSLSAFVPEIL
jgi:hypothetical protein